MCALTDCDRSEIADIRARFDTAKSVRVEKLHIWIEFLYYHIPALGFYEPEDRNTLYKCIEKCVWNLEDELFREIK